MTDNTRSQDSRMTAPLKFLVVDFHAESRFLLVKTLLRKFPGAAIYEEDDAHRATEIVRTRGLSAVITHRTFEVSGCDLVRQFRTADPHVLIIMVSGIDRADSALEAGANSFLPYDEWLRIGSLVEVQLAGSSPQNGDPRRDYAA